MRKIAWDACVKSHAFLRTRSERFYWITCVSLIFFDACVNRMRLFATKKSQRILSECTLKIRMQSLKIKILTLKKRIMSLPYLFDVWPVECEPSSFWITIWQGVLAFHLFRIRLFRVRLFRVRLFRVRLFRVCLFRVRLFRFRLFRICLFRVCCLQPIKLRIYGLSFSCFKSAAGEL